MTDPSDPILIAVLGVTGAGKTTFISKATGRTNMKVGDGLESCTQEMEMADMTLDDGRRIILIDTPGFDDTHRTDTEILELIAKHLSITYAAGKLLNGIIVLQPITSTRVQGNERRNTRLLEKILGPNNFRSVVLATTFWGELSDRTKGAAREKERNENKDFWGTMIDRGARSTRHENSAASAVQIVRMLVEKPKITLLMQEEMAQNGGRFKDTSAGKQLNAELNAMCIKLSEDLERTREEAKQTKENLGAEITALQEKIKGLQEEQQYMDKSQIVWPARAIQSVADAFDGFGEWCKDEGIEYVARGGAAGLGGAAVLATLAYTCTVM